MTEQGEAKLAEYCRGANRWSSERRAKPRLELCRVATEEDKVKEEDEVSLFGLCRATETMEQRKERLSLLRLSRVVTEEDEVKQR